jgi:hypothetical protein
MRFNSPWGVISMAIPAPIANTDHPCLSIGEADRKLDRASLGDFSTAPLDGAYSFVHNSSFLK